jgi:hypothetical protein
MKEVIEERLLEKDYLEDFEAISVHIGNYEYVEDLQNDLVVELQEMEELLSADLERTHSVLKHELIQLRNSIHIYMESSKLNVIKVSFLLGDQKVKSLEKLAFISNCTRIKSYEISNYNHIISYGFSG